jgi:ABC-type proline/glycine betaine transport system ATPase subunit
MKQTGVEWLIDEYFGGIENCTPYFRNKIFQAIEMEKQKTIEFAKHCLDKAKDLDIRTAFMNVEEYYETFKQKEQ